MKFITAQLPFQFSEEKLLKDLSICEEYAFEQHYNQEDFSGDWSGIALRSPDGSETNINAISLSGEFIDTRLLQQCPYFREVIETFECDKTVVRLLNLKAGSRIKEHQDYELGYEDGCFRIHVPITTNPEVTFYFSGEPLHMEVGSCWYGDFNEPHRVDNLGTTNRIHLIIDCLRNDWSDQLFGELGYPFESEGKEELDIETKLLVIKELERHNTPEAQLHIDRLKAEIQQTRSSGKKSS